MRVLEVALCGIMAARLSQAYSSSEDDCNEFAALWDSSCAGEAYSEDDDWETDGAGVTISSCSGDDSFEPDTGDEVSSYAVFARNCITCRTNDDGLVMIRYQTNNMPKHCYGSNIDFGGYTEPTVTQEEELDSDGDETPESPIDVVTYSTFEGFPVMKKIDIEMAWNPDVLRLTNVDEADVDSAAKT